MAKQTEDGKNKDGRDILIMRLKKLGYKYAYHPALDKAVSILAETGGLKTSNRQTLNALIEKLIEKGAQEGHGLDGDVQLMTPESDASPETAGESDSSQDFWGES